LNKTFLHDRNANFLKKEKDIYAICAPNATGKSGGVEERGGVGWFPLKIKGQDGKNTAARPAVRAEGG
jgi:hypothetical protein